MRTQFFLKSLVVVFSVAVIPVTPSIAQARATHHPAGPIIKEVRSDSPATPGGATRMRVSKAYGKLPLHFEANQGQTDSHVRFLSHGSGSTVFLTPTEAVLTLRRARTESLALGFGERMKARVLPPLRPEQPQATVLRMQLVGANRSPQVVGREELPGKANYFIGNDPTKWRTNIPTYKKVVYTDIYPGIDLIYYGNRRQLEYDLVVHPGADPTQIMLGFEGADRLEVDAEGDLVLHTADGALRQRRPVIYQEVAGVRLEVPGGYVLRGPQAIGFQVAAYDRSSSLVIDPTLVYSTYLGGSASDQGRDIAVDAAGAAYVTGITSSADFPTACTAPCTVPDSTRALDEAFVTKLDPTGTALVYSTYLGGSGFDHGNGIAVDAEGAAYVTGVTTSRDFPVGCPAPCMVLDSTVGGFVDAFVTKLDPTGTALVSSTYLGGSGNDAASGIAVDAEGAAFVTGTTGSTDFPTACTAPCRVLDSTLGSGDAFVTKLNATGTALVYSTYLGGSGSDGDEGAAIAVDAEGAAYVTGTTGSADFTAGCTAPCTALDTTLGGSHDVFVAKLDPTGTALVYSTYLGGSGVDQGFGIAVGAAGAAYVTGRAMSADFTAGCTAPCRVMDATLGGSFDAFVTKVNAAGTALEYSTYLGGSSEDDGFGIAVDAAGAAYVTGFTFSTDFPTGCAAPCAVLDPNRGGQLDAFLAKIAEVHADGCPSRDDADHDGFHDANQRFLGTFPGNPDSDRDGIKDDHHDANRDWKNDEDDEDDEDDECPATDKRWGRHRSRGRLVRSVGGEDR